MNEMIWNTLGIWLISLGILFSITLFGALFSRGLGATLFFIFSGLFIVPITSMIAGFRAANGKGNIIIILIITIIIGIILLYFVSDGFYLSLIPLLITLLGFGLGKLMMLIKNINPIWHGVSIFLTIFTFAILIYLLSAFGSEGAYSPIPNEWFYVRPPNSPNVLSVQLDSTNTHLVFSDEINKPFTGKVTSFLY